MTGLSYLRACFLQGLPLLLDGIDDGPPALSRSKDLEIWILAQAVLVEEARMDGLVEIRVGLVDPVEIRAGDGRVAVVHIAELARRRCLFVEGERFLPLTGGDC